MAITNVSGTAPSASHSLRAPLLIFLAGTNIGAAVYEYGLAALSNTFLDRRTRRSE